MKFIEDRDSGMRIRFAKGWDIIPDDKPHRMIWIICDKCGAEYSDGGLPLEVKTREEQWRANHPCVT